MSRQSISEKSQVIRNETQKYANTRARVADVIDDLNATKADEIALQEAIENGINPLKDDIKDLYERIDEEAQIRTDNDANLYDSIAKKVDKPTVTATDTQAYRYVTLLDDANNSARYPAGDLGKNVANSNPTSVEGAGMAMGAPWTLNANNFPLNFTGLPDKSSDATFNQLVQRNTAGQLAVTNGANLMKSMPSLLSEVEKNDWRVAMNGGWTTNTMSVSLINPTVILNRDVVQYVTLMGANLNLNPANFKVEITSNDGKQVIAEIPNSQVQLDTTGVSMVFYYNFKNIPVNEYKIRLSNGVASYLTPSFNVESTQNVLAVDSHNLSWTFVTKGDVPYDGYSTNSGNSITVGLGIEGQHAKGDVLLSAISSAIRLQDGSELKISDNFLLELKISDIAYPERHTFGIVGDNNNNNNNNNNNQFGSILTYVIGGNAVGTKIRAAASNIPGVNGKVLSYIIIKRSNILTVAIYTSDRSQILSEAFNNSTPTAVALKLNRILDTAYNSTNNNNNNKYKLTVTLVGGYKF